MWFIVLHVNEAVLNDYGVLTMQVWDEESGGKW